MRDCVQGFGVRVSPLQAGTPAFTDTIMEVLRNPLYTAAAQALSAKIKARKDTPVQEAAGEQIILSWLAYLDNLLWHTHFLHDPHIITDVVSA